MFGFNLFAVLICLKARDDVLAPKLGLGPSGIFEMPNLAPSQTLDTVCGKKI